MNHARSTEDIINDILVAGLDDWVYLAELIAIIHQMTKRSDDEVRRQGLELMRNILTSGTSGVQPATGETPLSDEELLHKSLEVIRQILTSGWMSVGVLAEDMSSFVPWQLTIAEALARIEGEWRALGRTPSLWEICWFSNTPLGDEKARQAH